MEGGLGQALLSLDKLTNVELIKFAVSGGLVESLHKVSSLKSLSIWPDTEKQVRGGTWFSYIYCKIRINIDQQG